MALPQSARLLLIEDASSFRGALEAVLRDAEYRIRVESDGNALSAVMAEFRPDLAIVGASVSSGPGGYDISRMLRGSSDLPILLLTEADNVEDRLRAFESGADDYLMKPFSMEELLARIRALLRRSGRVSSDTLQVADLIIDTAGHTVMRAGRQIDLTEREYQLLVALARRPGRVMSKVQLLEQVWGFADYDTNLVEVHVSALRRKLETEGPRLVQTRRGMGYVLTTR